MTATAHSIVGASIAAATIQNPILGLTLATISHPLLDLVPHWDLGWGWREKSKVRLFLESAGDVLVGLTLAFVIFGNSSIPVWYFLACIFLSISWDVLEAPYWFFNWRFFPFGFIYNVQSRMQGKATLPWGLITQVVTVGLAVYLANTWVFQTTS
ncbi:hypothetical protein A3H85_01030 [Candidatus Daviesbacteria bacterium RIFCSPLOWO2_02_FULL_40_8]|uniref:Hydrolase n=1 Tax=Candidatus Daviesbacteria bacterium RIFCSPLOWO2_01_FULL_40_24 TaxID=1797787 RepID=A0A1F5MK20_9BACT|nr:MAG: hypothetical protein A2780_02400 [Candidatus Daviesbacteria bacterium RIFCSPHIGHO2_01_FULL_41_45]OGE35030.1 MAG: hypothetical protein A3C32_01270 [Candidatus Daviesbacteria bacterium RIFCSPHIGHO2_02_FULL_41_14]OGE65737.1 MAG: hypothetical protein A3B49_02680 [Candidatus Daviesbacteria bacterium RIFCSPLOWO2_01_FULL_40_24]OGE67060.1 MAG: hypothetical protein A3H85_01030 [Candidatus Daviesbacteria bacterium RIFCSPLOWO2_02_FULL_40_8]